MSFDPIFNTYKIEMDWRDLKTKVGEYEKSKNTSTPSDVITESLQANSDSSTINDVRLLPTVSEIDTTNASHHQDQDQDQDQDQGERAERGVGGDSNEECDEATNPLQTHS